MPVIIPFITIFSRHGMVTVKRDGKKVKEKCKHAGDESYLECHCRKHLRWTDPVTGKQVRKKAGTRSKDEANNIKTSLEREWRGEAPIAEPEGIMPVERAVALFIDHLVLTGITSLAHPRMYVRDLLKFCASPPPVKDVAGIETPVQPVVTLRGFTSEFAQHYMKHWRQPSVNTRLSKRVHITHFFNYCVEQGWLEKAPNFPPIKVTTKQEAPTEPLTEEEVSRLFKSIPFALNRPRSFKEDRRAVEILFTIQLNTGLAINDAVTLPRDRMQFDPKIGKYTIRTRRAKTGEPVCIPIEDDVAQKLQQTYGPHPQYFIWDGEGNRKESITSRVDRQVKTVFDYAGISSKGHMKSHRFRDTFAVNLLVKGVGIEDVADALGNTVEVARKHYAKWISERQDRLNGIIVSTFKKSPDEVIAEELKLLAILKAKHESSQQADPVLVKSA